MANILLSQPAFVLEDYTNISDFLSELNSTIDIARKDGDKIFGNYELQEINIIEGLTLLNFAITPFNKIVEQFPNLTNDAHKILIKLIGLNDTPENSHTLEELSIEFENDHNGLLGLVFNPAVNPDYEITNEKTWYNFHRQYFVEHTPSRQDFVDSLKKYFPNLHFSSSIASGLGNFQGTTYTVIVKTILYHLTALNDDFIDLFEKHHIEGADSVCERLAAIFSAKDTSTGLDISIDASRDDNGIAELLFSFTDSNRIDRNFDCNLHTKFESYFELQNPNHNQKSNRIYFHQPTNDFMKGKVLIGRIGRHRDIGFH